MTMRAIDEDQDREDYRLRVLIETMERQSRPEQEIHTAVRGEARRMQRDTSRPRRTLPRRRVRD
jgi:hypothetical protein